MGRRVNLDAKPILLTKENGDPLWVFPRDVLRVEDNSALLSEYSYTAIYFRDGQYRRLKRHTAREVIELLWPNDDQS